MSKFVVYLKLEIKKALKTIPYLLAGAIALMLLIGVIAFCSSRMLYQNKIAKQIDIGVVMPENDPLADMGISLLSSMESVKSFCNFIYMEEEDAKAQLKDNKLFAVLLIPSGFVEDIMNGTNTPVTVILPENIGIEAALLKELTDAGENMLGSSQAGIYAAGEYFMNHNLTMSIPEMEKRLNQIYMDFVLSRDLYFKETVISATGELSVTEFYMASAAVLFLLLCGIPCSSFLKRESDALRAKLNIAGTGATQIILAKTIAVAVVLTIITLVFGSIGILLLLMVNRAGIELTFIQIATLIPVILAVSSLIVFIYEIMKTPVESVMLIFVSTIVMLFLSGGFIPIGLLPESVGRISPFIPTTVFLKQIGTVITDEVTSSVTIITCVLSLLFYFMTVGVSKWRQWSYN